jgi:hypothetical protein
MRILKVNFLRNSFLFLVLIGLMSSCSPVELISRYDELTDKTVNEMQQKTSSFLEKMKDEIGTDGANYKNHKTFYLETKVCLNTLLIRANAVEKNDITIQHITLLRQNIDALESLHKIGFTSLDQLIPIDRAFNRSYTAIIKLQLAKKQGVNK